MAKRIAIELHIVSKASNYVQNESGLIESIVTEHGSHEREAALLGEIRKRDKDIFSMLKQVGVLDDPESQKSGLYRRVAGLGRGGAESLSFTERHSQRGLC